MLVSVILFALYQLFHVFASMTLWMCSFEMIRGQFNKKITSVVYSVAIVFNSEHNGYTCKSVFIFFPGSVIQDHWSDHVASKLMNLWIHSERGFIGFFDLPWSKWSRITDPYLDPKRTHPFTIYAVYNNKVLETVRQKTFASLNTTQTERTTLMQ